MVSLLVIFQLNLKFNQGTTARYAEIGILFSAKTNGKQAKEITPKPKMLLNMFIFSVSRL